MKQLSKKAIKVRDELAVDLTVVANEFCAAAEAYNEAVDKAYVLFQQAIRDAAEECFGELDYMTAIDKAAEFKADVVELARDWREDRSDRWIESGAGEAHYDWVDHWDELELETPEIYFWEPEPPEQIDPELPSDWFEFGTIPTAPERAYGEDE